MARLGVITIGQSPRVDLTPELTAILPGVTLVERGILDGLTKSQIAALAPEPDDTVLTSRLADGTSCIIGERAVLARMPALIASLEEDVDAIFLACTGQFPPFEHKKPLFIPDRLISFGTAALSMDMPKIGVICPLKEQQAFTVEKFKPRLEEGTEVLTAHCSPYTGTEKELVEVSKDLKKRGVGIIALDCMGYTEKMRRTVAAAAGVPVVLARAVAARLAAEVLASM